MTSPKKKSASIKSSDTLFQVSPKLNQSIDIPKPKTNPPSSKKIMSMLNQGGVVRQKICTVLVAGLKATKPIVADGEIIEYAVDFEVRRRYAETILDVMGEKKSEVDPTLHIHFTSILQQIRAYERGDKRAIDQAGFADSD